MSTSMNNLFNYSRSLPEPFKALSSKKVKTTSVYGNGTEATLCATVIKAVNAVCACMNGTGQGAVGIIDHRSVAEYKSSNSPEEYHFYWDKKECPTYAEYKQKYQDVPPEDEFSDDYAERGGFENYAEWTI